MASGSIGGRSGMRKKNVDIAGGLHGLRLSKSLATAARRS